MQPFLPASKSGCGTAVDDCGSLPWLSATGCPGLGLSVMTASVPVPPVPPNGPQNIFLRTPADEAAFRNSTLQGGFFIGVPPAVGPDIGAMSGFSNAWSLGLSFPQAPEIEFPLHSGLSGRNRPVLEAAASLPATIYAESSERNGQLRCQRKQPKRRRSIPGTHSTLFIQGVTRSATSGPNSSTMTAIPSRFGCRPSACM